MITVHCQYCGKPFEIKPSSIKHGRGKHCSPECQYAAIKARSQVECVCERCGKIFYVTKSKWNKDHPKYCSRMCHNPPHYRTCTECGKRFRYSPSSNQVYCSKQCAYNSELRNQHCSKAVKMSWRNPETRARIMKGIQERSTNPDWYNAKHFQSGEDHPRWQGGKSKERSTLISRYEYKSWRSAVYKRDNFTCQHCGQYGRDLIAHHIKSWADYPELRFDVDNGLTLCRACHDKLHGYIKKPKTRICPVCGERFKLRHPNHRFCSQACAAQVIHNHQKRSDKICEHCGKSFYPKRATVRYCSHECAYMARRKHNR